MSDFRQAPAFDFYPERWTHGTRHMTKTERCDYLDLLCHQWTDDGLPADAAILARLLGYKQASQIPAMVLEKFPVGPDGKRRNSRLEQERNKQRERYERKANGAAQTNAKRWGKRHTHESLSESLSDAAEHRLAIPERHDSESLHARLSSDLRPPTSASASAEGVQGERASPPPAAAGNGETVIQSTKTPRKAQPITEEWLDELATRYPYADIRQQLTKARTWVETKPGRSLSRPFFVNWLNRIEPPPNVRQGNGQDHGSADIGTTLKSL